MKLKKKKRILIVLYYYRPYVSGVTVYAEKLAESLVRRGHYVTILTSRYDNNLAKQETINGVKVIRSYVLFRKDKGVVMPFFWLQAILLARSHDVFNPHLPMPDTGLSSIFIPREKNITTYQCDIRLSEGILSKIIVYLSFVLMRIQLNRSRKIVTLSNDYFEHSKMSRYITKSLPIYPPIIANEFKPTDPATLQKQLGLSSKHIYVGYFGRVVYEKGIGYLIEALPELIKKIPNMKIVIGGEYANIAGGGVKKDLDKYSDKYPGRIVFTGYLDDYQRQQFYSMLDVMVLPSIDPLEAFGIVQVESMLCGTPVVASDIPGVREVVKATGYGVLSMPKDSKDIAKKIIHVLENIETYKPQRSMLLKTFSLEKTIQKYEDLF